MKTDLQLQSAARIGASLADFLLDSSLILDTNNSELYDIKFISCGDYIQIYSLEDKRLKKKKIEKEYSQKNIKHVITDDLIKKERKIVELKNIEQKNINRSKLECQRIAKANSSVWKTFITLTFEKNILDIDKANIRFKYFISKVRRIFRDFKYICIPEFQKRGAVHYHLLTNIDINDKKLIFSQENNKKFKHIKYWNDGFTKVDNLNKDIKKIIGYISKYMTKDADNRLFNHHRYFYSRNLEIPKISYLNLSNPKHLEFYNKNLNQKKLIYTNTYKNIYNNDLIEFKEYL